MGASGRKSKKANPQCGRGMKTSARGNNDAPGITKYGSLVQLDAQIVALRPRSARTALRAPPLGEPAPKPRMGHILGYVDGFQRHITHLQCPTFCGFHPLESPGKTSGPLN